MKKLFFILFILISCVSFSQRSGFYGALGTVIPNAVGSSDDTSSFTSHSIVYTEVWDDAYQCLNCGTIYAPDFSTLSRFKFTTSARWIKVSAKTNMPALTGGDGSIGVTVNGVTQVVYFQVSNTTKLVDLGSEGVSKNVELINGTAILLFGSTVTGSYFTAIQYPVNRSISIASPVTADMVLIGNSITAGFGTTVPEINGIVTLLRNTYGHNIAEDGFSAQSLYYQDSTNTLRDAFIARLAIYDAPKYYFELQTNDFGLDNGLWSGATYQTRLADFLDAAHTAMPTAHFYIQSAIVRTLGDGANRFGDSIKVYRTADSTVCLTRAYTTYINGLNLLVPADLNDGLHPNDAGAIKYAHIIDSLVTW